MTPAVTMRRTERGFVRPFADALPARDLARILAVCPGVALDGPVAQAPVHPVWGPVLRTTRAWATVPATRFAGSSGGVIRAPGASLLPSGAVDARLPAGPGASPEGRR